MMYSLSNGNSSTTTTFFFLNSSILALGCNSELDSYGPILYETYET